MLQLARTLQEHQYAENILRQVDEASHQSSCTAGLQGVYFESVSVACQEAFCYQRLTAQGTLTELKKG